MFVSVSKHHCGLGRILISAIISHATQSGKKKLICAASLNAIDFYVKMGFQKLNLRDAGKYGQVMDMEKKLTI